MKIGPPDGIRGNFVLKEVKMQQKRALVNDGGTLILGGLKSLLHWLNVPSKLFKCFPNEYQLFRLRPVPFISLFRPVRIQRQIKFFCNGLVPSFHCSS